MLQIQARLIDTTFSHDTSHSPVCCCHCVRGLLQCWGSRNSVPAQFSAKHREQLAAQPCCSAASACPVLLQVLAKLETRQSLFAFRHITQEADGIIMSRGNLGLDVLAEKMALVQKALVQTCNVMGKPCIITRVVDTMVTAPRPTRQAGHKSPSDAGCV